MKAIDVYKELSEELEGSYYLLRSSIQSNTSTKTKEEVPYKIPPKERSKKQNDEECRQREIIIKCSV